LQRQPGQPEDLELWRLVTSLLVHDGWLALGSNVLLLGVVGVTFEQRGSRAEWLALYLCGGTAGQVVGWSWAPLGAGNSVAALGLAGGLALMALRGWEIPEWTLGYVAVVLAVLARRTVAG